MTNQQKIEDNKAFWDIKKAGERLLWRFNAGKSFIPNDNDKMALKSVLGWVNRQASDNVENNQLFAKLYIYFLTQGLRYYETTVFDNAIQKELSALLDKPLALFYKAFIQDLYGNQLNKLQLKKIEDYSNVISDAEKFKETFNEDYVINKLNEMISEALNRFS